MRLCGIGFSLCVFPVGGSPGFNPGEHGLQACGKSASTRRASAPALRLVAQPFLAVRLWSVGSPLTAFFATFRFPATRLPCLPRACLPQAGFEGSEVEGPLLFTIDCRLLAFGANL